MRAPLVLRVLFLVLPVLLPSFAHAQSAAFTYQGRLNDGGAPANGLHDFRFKLFDAASGGTQVGTTQCVDNLSVTGGTFTATLDFGNQFVTPAQRYIEIEVRRDTGLTCSNVGGFIVLAPRQLIAAAPVATHAKSAFSLDSSNGGIANVVFVDNSGKVGIGTTTPTHTVHIANAEPTLALQDTDSSGAAGGQQVGYVSYRDNGNIERAWVGFGSPGDPNFTMLNARPSGNIVLQPFFGNVGINTTAPAAMLDVAGGGLFSGSLGVIGSVGIGTNSPATKLDVRGDIRLGSTGQYQAAAGEERLRLIRGTIDADGTILAGSGFSVTNLGSGTYHIEFTTPFLITPSVTAQIRGAAHADDTTMLTSVFPNSVDLRTYSSGFTGWRFNFIAVGAR